MGRRILPGLMPGAVDARARTQAFSRKNVRRAWILFALLDTVWVFGVRARLASLVGRVVICDRYVWDTMIDLELRFGKRMPVVRGVLRAVCPRPDLAILFVLPMKDILERFERKNEQFREPAPVRQERFDRYAALASGGGFRVVDATRPMDEIAFELGTAVGL